MVSYAELNQELVWREQFVPQNMTSMFIEPLRVHYRQGPMTIGAPGDNNHLYGRHRSYNWDLVSRYSQNRRYGTTAPQDQGGDRNWYRAVDIGIQGQPLWEASRRLDEAVRAGWLPGVAEWFGTFDGQTVVGWFEGNEASSDISHLTHLHVGVWNEFANDAALMTQLYAIITGEGHPMAENMILMQDTTNQWWLMDRMMFRRRINFDSTGDVQHWMQAFGMNLVTWSSQIEMNAHNANVFGVDVSTWGQGDSGGSTLIPHNHKLVAGTTGGADPI